MYYLWVLLLQEGAVKWRSGDANRQAWNVRKHFYFAIESRRAKGLTKEAAIAEVQAIYDQKMVSPQGKPMVKAWRKLCDHLKVRNSSTHYTPLTTHYSLLTTHYLFLTTRISILAAHYSLLTTPYSLLTTHYSLLTTHHLPATVYYLPLTTYYLLLTTYYLLHRSPLTSTLR